MTDVSPVIRNYFKCSGKSTVAPKPVFYRPAVSSGKETAKSAIGFAFHGSNICAACELLLTIAVVAITSRYSVSWENRDEKSDINRMCHVFKNIKESGADRQG